MFSAAEGVDAPLSLLEVVFRLLPSAAFFLRTPWIEKS